MNTENVSKEQKGNDVNHVLGTVKYKFWLHNGELLYSCKTDEKKNKYERQLKAKNIKYTLEVVGA